MHPTLPPWSPTGPLATARAGHTATLLPDGKVLVVGGSNSSSGVLSSAEVYNPASSTWSATDPLDWSRAGHTATLLPNGKVLVTGGFDSSYAYLEGAQLYDPVLGTWSWTDPLPRGQGRHGHTATLLSDGKVLVTGGFGGEGESSGIHASTHVYDPVLGAWSATAPLNETRGYHAATLLPDGKVLVAGGWSDGPDAFLDTAEVYDPTSGTWSATDSMASVRSLFTATSLPDGTVLAVGGYDSDGNGTTAEVYEP